MEIDDQVIEACMKHPGFKNHILHYARAFKRTRSEWAAQRLEEFGISIDIKDYGADQNIEKGQQDY